MRWSVLRCEMRREELGWGGVCSVVSIWLISKSAVHHVLSSTPSLAHTHWFSGINARIDWHEKPSVHDAWILPPTLRKNRRFNVVRKRSQFPQNFCQERNAAQEACTYSSLSKRPPRDHRLRSLKLDHLVTPPYPGQAPRRCFQCLGFPVRP